MANFKIKLDLLKLSGAFMMNVKGEIATKRCLVIPVDEAGIFIGEKGVYLNLIASEMQEPRYSDTHFVKVNLDKEAYTALSEEERKAIPILGGMHEFGQRPKTIATSQTVEATELFGNAVDDLPF